MAYKSPIELICDDIQWHMEQATVKAVQHYFPLVDEEELGKALRYDRNQYAAGFIDGRAARDAEIVRCKDCKHFEDDHWEKVNGVPLIVSHEICKRWGNGCKTSEDGFCFLGERKETDDG